MCIRDRRRARRREGERRARRREGERRALACGRTRARVRASVSACSQACEHSCVFACVSVKSSTRRRRVCVETLYQSDRHTELCRNSTFTPCKREERALDVEWHGLNGGTPPSRTCGGSRRSARPRRGRSHARACPRPRARRTRTCTRACGAGRRMRTDRS
eukprot:4067601-Pleurochrysis_carterae.AAC.2